MGGTCAAVLVRRQEDVRTEPECKSVAEPGGVGIVDAAQWFIGYRD